MLLFIEIYFIISILLTIGLCLMDEDIKNRIDDLLMSNHSTIAKIAAMAVILCMIPAVVIYAIFKRGGKN